MLTRPCASRKSRSLVAIPVIAVAVIALLVFFLPTVIFASETVILNITLNQEGKGEFFVNFGDSSYLKQYGPFAPFGRVVEGMDVVDSLHSGYGEGAPKGRGPSQGEIARQGNAYLKASFPELDAIARASLLSP